MIHDIEKDHAMLEALSQVTRALRPLNDDERRRVMSAANTLLGTKSAPGAASLDPHHMNVIGQYPPGAR